MNLTVKDIVHIVSLVVTFSSIMIGLKFMLTDIRKDMRNMKKILYGDRGALNVISNDVCKEHRDHVFAKIRKNETVSEMLLLELKEIKETLIVISVHMKIRTPNGLKYDRQKDQDNL